MDVAYPSYPLLNPTTLTMAGAYLLGKRRDFRSDALSLISAINPPLIVMGAFPDSVEQGCVITVNHYWRMGFKAWWIGIAISAIVPHPVHWAMTSAWIYPDPLRSLTITPLSRWFLKRIATCYGFTLMPPMPSRPQDVWARASAVRSLLHYTQSVLQPIVVIAPEGADTEGGCLTPPPKGIGRLLYLFIERGMSLLPCGIFEEDGQLHLHFGETLTPSIEGLRRQEREQSLVSFTMRAIAACLPERLRGTFA
ncbi:MAG: hypothetical protein A2Z14_08265 [Chloroflexi bacterium RBG_16_48_8]|nr:MAG: hypothetical protein A2Z14_08265 [Chloroflexi bacterium RBG_16_48_8]